MRAKIAAFVHRSAWEVFLVGIAISTLLIAGISSPHFFNVSNIINLFQLSVEKAIVALVLGVVIISGEIDLSVAAIMGLAAAVMAWLFQSGVPLPFAISASLLVGLCAGIFNGFFIAYVGLPSLVVTLAGLIGFRGAARILIEDKAIGGFPDWFVGAGQRSAIGPFTPSIIIFLTLAIAIGILLHRTILGRKIYVLGGNAAVATYSGINVARIKLTIFGASGLISALAGVLYAARLGSVRGDTALGFELDIITIVLLGGVSVVGGSGSILGLVLSVIIILSLRNGMGLLDISGNTQSSLIGVLLILAVLAPSIINYLIDNRAKGQIGRGRTFTES